MFESAPPVSNHCQTCHSFGMPDAISTAELVGHLGRLGLRVTAESLRADVHRGLVSPLMPEVVTSGRGSPARWTPQAARRAEYIARLRARGVNGHVLPLLAFVYDGWGWQWILPALQASARKGWEIDRRSLSRAGRVRTEADLVLNVDTGAPEGSALDWASELRPARIALVTGAWSGAPAAGSSVVPFVEALARQIPALEQGSEARAEREVLGKAIEAARRSRPLAARDFPEWLRGPERRSRRSRSRLHPNAPSRHAGARRADRQEFVLEPTHPLRRRARRYRSKPAQADGPANRG